MEATKRVFADVIYKRGAEIQGSHPEPGLTRHVGASNDKLFLAEHHMEKGWVGAPHSHPHDQVVYIISGHIRLTVQGRTYDLRPGDSLALHGGIEHQASAPEASHVIDVFTPCREDYL